MVRLLICAVLLARAHGTITGNPSCRCIDPWGQGHGGAPEEMTFVDQETGRGCLKGEAGNCFPLDYGSKRCFAWDLNLAPRCADVEGRPLSNAPGFCKAPWCYVDPSCRLVAQNSKTFSESGFELSYSYETCRAVDATSIDLLVNTLRGKTLRAGVPAADVGGALMHTGPGQKPSGWTADWMHYIADKVGADIMIVDISEDSRNEYPQSSYSACVRDVSLGHLDFCYGTFWETPERLSMCNFSPIFTTDLYYLVVEGKDSSNFSGMLVKVFLPFAPSLWFLLAFLTFLVGFFMWLFGEVGDYDILTGSFMGLHMAWMKFFGHGGGWDNARTRSGNFLLFGFSLICMLGLASYTANLSSFLLMANLHTGLQSLDAAIEANVKICTLQAASDMVESSYPAISPLLYKVDNWGPMLDAYKSGKCGAMLMARQQFTSMRAAIEPFDKYGKLGLCDLRLVGGVTLSIPAALPLNRDLDHALSYVWSREKFTGALERLLLDYPSPSSDCPAQDGLREGATSMNIGDLFGGLLVMIILLAGSVACWIAGWGRHNVDELPSGDIPDSDNAGVLKAMKELENAMKERAVPWGQRRPDNLRDFLEQSRENPKKFIGVCCIFFTVFLTFALLIGFLKSTV